MKRSFTSALLSIASVVIGTLGVLAPSFAHAESTAICYNCPPEWADWASQIAAIQKATGIRVPFDNKNSGQAIAQLMAEHAPAVVRNSTVQNT